MANTLQLKNDIKKLKTALASKSLSASIKNKLKGKLEKAEKDLKSTAPRKATTAKSTIASLKELVKKKKYSIYKKSGVDLKKDSEEPALPIGRRVSKGLKGNQYGNKKSSKGNVYYEYRANRLDVKQPSKTAKYPRLADGGEVEEPMVVRSYFEEESYEYSHGGKLSKKDFFKKYEENEDENMHSENVVLLAENYGTESDIRDAKTILAKHESIGNLPTSLRQERDVLHDKLYAKYVQSREDGGMMAEGGKLPTPDTLYALMKLDKEMGYGSIFDGRVYTKKEAENLKNRYQDNLRDGMELKIFSVTELLSRKSLPAQSKARILDSYKTQKKNISYLAERFGDDYNWQQDYMEKGGYMAEGGELNVNGIINKFGNYINTDEAQKKWDNSTKEERLRACGYNSDYQNVKFKDLPIYVKSDVSQYYFLDKYGERTTNKSMFKADGGMMAKGGEVDADYRKKLDYQIYKTGLSKEVNGFKLKKEAWSNMSELLWVNKFNPALEIYATPFFTPDHDINFEVFVNDEGVAKKDEEYVLTGNLDKDIERYFYLLSRFTKKYAKGKMEDGGMMAHGGKLSKKDFFKKYEENEDENMHSENVVLLAENYGTESDIRDAKTILAKHESIGNLPTSLRHERDALHDKLYAKYVQSREDGGMMAEGGVTEKEVVDSNAQMVLSNVKEVKHHADELSKVVTKKSNIEAWVVAKIERASTDLSDITHYLEGQHDKMSMGGSVYNHVHKMDKK